MTGGLVANIVLPIVIFLALSTWLGMLFYANAHPHRGRYQRRLPTEVQGGAFQAVESGRQLMPIPHHARAEVPGQREAAESENYRVPEEETAQEAERRQYADRVV